MITLYNFLILMMRVGIGIASLFNGKAKAFVAGRKEAFAKLEGFGKSGRSNTVWIHCASLGEFEQGRPVIEAIRKEDPKARIVVTFFSPSGYEVRKNYDKADLICYLPWDTRNNAERFLEHVQPTLAIFVKYEFWFHYLNTLERLKIPAISISAIFRDSQLFFKSYGGFYRGMLRKLSHIFVQNESSRLRLENIGILNASVAGDTRFDRVSQIVSLAESIPAAEKFKSGKKIVVVGSCWGEDLNVLGPIINDSDMKFIIAPHELTEHFIAKIEKEINRPCIRYSTLEGVAPDSFHVLIIDNMGMLSRLYRYGEFAFVGGAYGKGLHNILEAACYGIPILFGDRNFTKFQEAVDLTSRGGAFAVAGTDELRIIFSRLSDPQVYAQACEVNKTYVRENLGATEKIMMYTRSVLR